MKHFLFLTIFLLLSCLSFGQYVQITHLAGSAVYGTTNVTLEATGSYGTGGGDCLTSPTPYRVAGAPGSSPGTRTFVFSPKVYSVKLYCERIHNTEFIQMSVNASTYALTTANMINYTDCYGLYFCSVSGGNLVGPPTDDHSGGTFLINDCAGIDSVTVYCNGLVGGSTFYIWMDTTRCIAATSNAPICENDTLKLFASGGDTTATYTWYGPGGYTAVGRNQVIPNAAAGSSGIYTVMQSGGRSKDTGTVSVTINSIPVVTAGGNSPVCYGGSINLTASPSSTGETFSWSGPGTFTSATQNPTVSPATPADTGTYTVVTSLNGCHDTSAVHITMNYIALPWDSASSPVCLGDTIRLYASDSTTGVTWGWSGPGGYSSPVQNPVINSASAANSGIFTVTATANGCSRSDTILVTVGSASAIIPAILPHVRVCSGTTLSLQLDPTTIDPGATYIWSGPDGFTYTGLNPVITNIITAQSGLYSVYATTGGCNTTMQHNNFVVDSTPEVPSVSNNSAICSDSTLRLFSSDNTDGVSYSWSGPGAFASTQQNPVIYNSTTTMSGNYTVTVTLGLCSNNAVTTVLVNQTPTNPMIGSNSPVCEGGLLNLTASFTPYSGIFHWTGPNSFTSLLQNPAIPNVTSLAAGTYSVYEIVNGCTSDTISVDVTISPTPATPVATSNSPVCEGGTLNLNATDATPGVTYSWGGPNSFSAATQSASIANVTPAASGIYTVTVTLGNCSSTGSTNVSITNAPTITVSNNGPVCSGDTLKLFASTATGNIISWTGPYSFSAGGPSPVRYPAIMEYAGVYNAVATEPGGCTSVAFDTVVIKQSPPAPWVTWLTYCQYDYAPQLMAVDAANVLWFTSSSGGTGTATPPTPNTSVPGVYFFYLNQTVNGCTSDIDSIQVLVNPKPGITVTPADTAICPRDSILYHANSTDPAASVAWTPAYLFTNPTATSAMAHPIGDVTFMAVVTNIYNCTDTAYAHATVNPAAIITLDAGDSVILAAGEAYHIQPTTNCVSFAWFPPEGLSSAVISDPTANPDINTRYVVTGYTESGCKAIDSIYFHVNSDVLLGIPNAFTPGTGANNEFRILDKGEAKLNYFRVFNRWGNMVFETNDINKGWDGTYKGEPQPFGVYVYEVQAVSSHTGKLITKKGNITLLR